MGLWTCSGALDLYGAAWGGAGGHCSTCSDAQGITEDLGNLQNVFSVLGMMNFNRPSSIAGETPSALYCLRGQGRDRGSNIC